MTAGHGGGLILIGGAERKDRRGAILREVCRPARGADGKLVLIASATQVPQTYVDAYLPVFSELGVGRVDVLDIRTRADACSREGVQRLGELLGLS